MTEEKPLYSREDLIRAMYKFAGAIEYKWNERFYKQDPKNRNLDPK